MDVVAFRKVEDPEPQLRVRRQKDREHNLLVLTAAVPQSQVGLVDESEREFRELVAQLEDSIYELSDLDELVG